MTFDKEKCNSKDSKEVFEEAIKGLEEELGGFATFRTVKDINSDSNPADRNPFQKIFEGMGYDVENCD